MGRRAYKGLKAIYPKGDKRRRTNTSVDKFFTAVAKAADSAIKAERRAAKKREAQASRSYGSYGHSSSHSSGISGLYGSGASYTPSSRSYDEDYGVNMNMDHSGHITFSFTDYLGRPITDEATIQKLIRKTKNHYQYKERLATLYQMTYDEVNGETAEFTEIYKKTPDLKLESEVNWELSRLAPKKYTPRVFSDPLPDKNAIRAKLVEKAEREISYFFWWKNKPARTEYVEKKLPILYEEQMNAWKSRKMTFEHQEQVVKKKQDEKYFQEFLQARAPFEDYLSDSDIAIINALKREAAVIDDSVPGDFGLDFFLDLDYETVYVEVDLPEVSEIPTQKAEYLESGAVSFKKKTQKDIQKDYIKCICGLAFYIAGHFFNVNKNINYIQVSGYTQRINKATGNEDDEYVYSVFFDRDKFSLLSIKNIDPFTAMNEFPCIIKASVTGVLTTITPYPVPGDPEHNPDERPSKEKRFIFDMPR